MNNIDTIYSTSASTARPCLKILCVYCVLLFTPHNVCNSKYCALSCMRKPGYLSKLFVQLSVLVYMN